MGTQADRAGSGVVRRLRALAIRIGGALTPWRRGRQFAAELASHLELHVDENIRRGMTPEEARRQALVALGGVQAAREAYRDRVGLPVLDGLAQDVRFAVRMLRKTPSFTLACVLMLALGIGVNAAVFSLVNALLLRPLNGGALDAELVGVYSGERARPDRYRMFSYPEYVELRERADAFSGLLAEMSVSSGIAENGRTVRGRATLVSWNYFAVLGTRLAAGRGFTKAEEDPLSRAAVAVVSYDFWRRRGFPQGIVGRQLVVNGSFITVVGVATEQFHGTMPVMTSDLWLPIGATALMTRDEGPGSSRISHDRSAQVLAVTGTLKPGITPGEAEARLAPVADALAAAHPQFNADQRLGVQPRSRTGIGPAPRVDTAPTMGASVLMALTGLVLLVACFNLANMMLARGGARRQEIAVRLALGGSRSRVVRQLVVEGLLLSAMAGVAALGLAWWAAATFVDVLRDVLQRTTVALDVSPDIRVVGVVIAASIASTIVFGLGPAWRLSRPALATAMKPAAPEGAVRAGRFSLSGALVVAQIAVSLALVIAAGVFIRSATRAARADPGFALPGGLLTELDAGLIDLTEAEGRQVYASVLARVRALPGVADASLASIVPFGSRSEGRLIRREPGSAPRLRPGQAEDEPMFATMTVVGARYFSSLGLPILAGRDFTEAEERDEAAPVAIVDRVFAERVFGGSAVGRVVPTLNWDGSPAGTVQIVGVVPTVRDEIVEAPNRAHLYLPFGRDYRGRMLMHVRVEPGAEARMMPRVLRAIHEAEDRLPVTSLQTLTEHRNGSAGLWAIMLATRLLSVLGVIALALATVGVYGLRAYLVARRTREIGVRLALGASPRGIVGLLLHESARIAALGLVFGSVLALGLVQVLGQSEMLFHDVSPFDPLTFAVAPLLLAAVTAAASYVPARRALSIDPALALRPE